MTATVAARTAAATRTTATKTFAERPPLGWAVSDAITVAWRNLKGAMRTPQVVVFSTIQPIIFVLNFRYVFGGAIGSGVPGLDYVDFLMPGIFVQTTAFGATQTAIAMATDLNTGLIERFRSLPMARSAVLAGRALADQVRSIVTVLLMLVVGFLVGFRVHTDVLGAIAAIVLLLAFIFAISWMFATVGLFVRNAEAAQAATFPVLAVLVFASSAFVPIRSMPGWLQAYADHQPVTDVVDATRALFLGGPTAGKVVIAIAWCVGIVAVFAPFAVARYRRAV